MALSASSVTTDATLRQLRSSGKNRDSFSSVAAKDGAPTDRPIDKWHAPVLQGKIDEFFSMKNS
jgi:hypothetical protein